MANNVAANPMELDTASTSAVVSPMNLCIMGIRWVGGTTAGHQMILKDAAGHILYSMVATAANYSEESQINAHAQNGIIMHTLASGKVYVYYK